jgi:hypothetical protein
MQSSFHAADKARVSSESIPVETYDADPLHEQVPSIEGGLRKKDLKRLQDATRSLDSWERYRALVDSSEEAYDLIDTSNREARFALIVMGTLNALPLVFLTRTDAIANLSAGERLAMIVLFSVYAILLLFFILQAIEALQPGLVQTGDWRLVQRSPRSSDRGAALRRDSSSDRRRNTGRRGRTYACHS